ncbi:helix-turn-helix domain-containing protein [Gudongella sp. DL1XJH-153]|uniref:helix-turn-helix domain-containing protein n=1 Tax=Gudongella sp. DL1XJH-153 TaxID=3409804 RepID=UPI003BB57851
MLLGKKIETLRKNRNLSYRKLAEICEIPSHSYIRNIETGIVDDPGLRTIIKLAKGFDLTVGELLEDVEVRD